MKGIYLVGGYPDRITFKECFKLVVENGFDFIEVGIPFSEPIADGPVIAKAINETIKKNISVFDILEDLQYLKKYKIKKYIMTYSNIIYGYGFKKFSDDFGKFVDGVIIPDLPNRLHYFFYEKELNIAIIPFVTPETRIEDINEIKKLKGDFIYFIGMRGITGGSVDLESNEIKGKMKELKDIIKQKKIVLGFGIKTLEDTRKALRVADGFVIGTAAVSHQHNLKEFEAYLKSLR